MEQQTSPLEQTNTQLLEQAAPPPAQSKNGMGFVFVIFALAVGGIGILGYQNYQLKQNIKELSATSTVNETIIPPGTPALVSPSPSLQRRTFSKLGISMLVVDGWTIKEDENAARVDISNGIYTLSIEKDPQITGGGIGFKYDGVIDNSVTVQTPITIAGIKATKHSVVIDRNTFAAQITNVPEDVDNLYGGSIIRTNEPNVLPELILKDRNNKLLKYGVYYDYKDVDAETENWHIISVNDPVHEPTMRTMDSMVESILID